MNTQSAPLPFVDESKFKTRLTAGYWKAVSQSLTEIVRAGGTIEAGLSGFKVVGTPPKSGAYEVLYYVPSTEVNLVRVERDQQGNTLKREVLTAQGKWLERR